jgi:arsenate reductase-like glutaredoxin family protein
MNKIKAFVSKHSLVLSFVFVLAIIAVGQFINKKIKQEIKNTENVIKEKYEQAKKYELDEENAPSQELINELTVKKMLFERNVNMLMDRFSTVYPVSHEFTLYPSIEFKEYLYFSSDRLYKKASRRRLRIPESLGFPMTGLVPEEQIKTWTLQFEVVKDMVNLILDSGVSVIEEITFGAPQKVSFYDMLPLKITVSGTSNEIMRCLKYFEQPSSYFTLKSFSIEKSGKGVFRMNMGINAIILKYEGAIGT